MVVPHPEPDPSDPLDTRGARDRPDRPAQASPWPFAGMVGLAAVLFLDLTSLTFLPWWTVTALVALWLVLLMQACRWFVRRPRGVVALAAVGLAAWIAVWVAALLL